MKKKILTLLFLCCITLGLKATVSIHSFAANSVMNTGKWVKMRVSENGVYKITHQQITALGLDPDDIRVYGYGGAILEEDFSKDTRWDDLPQQPIYRGADYILFYGQGPISWNYNTITEEFEHTVNPYSFYGYYFLASGVTSEEKKTIGKIAEVDLQGRTPVEIATFKSYSLHESDLVNLIAESGLKGSGREFYGEEFATGTLTRNLSLEIPNVVSGSTAYLKFDAAVYSYISGPSKSSFDVSVGGGTMNFIYDNVVPGRSDSYYIKAKTWGGDFSIPFSPSSPSVSVKLTFNPIVTSAKGWLNYLRITAERNLVMDGS